MKRSAIDADFVSDLQDPKVIASPGSKGERRTIVLVVGKNKKNLAGKHSLCQ